MSIEIVEFLAQRYDETEATATAAYVLVDIASRRQIVELHGRSHECSVYQDGDIEPCEFVHEFDICSTLQLLAMPFAAHPDYDPAWALHRAPQ